MKTMASVHFRQEIIEAKMKELKETLEQKTDKDDFGILKEDLNWILMGKGS